MERRFVKDIASLTKASPSQRSSRSTDINVRKWSVRKLRRRPRSVDNSKKRKHEKRTRSASTKLSPDKNTIPESAPDEFLEKENLETDTEKELKVKPDVLLFGSDFDKQPLAGSIDLDSDQDSTGGEDNEVLGEFLNSFL